MTTRREFVARAALLAPFALVVPAAAQDAESKADIAQFLFVQNAEGVAYADGVLTLKRVSPVTTLFSDRPERIAGHMTTESFIPFWSEGADSFASDPPNAALSVLDGADMDEVVVTLRNPRLKDGDLSYDVTVLEGQPPASGGAASLFIDIIGRPITPVSFAGAGRRAFRRTVVY